MTLKNAVTKGVKAWRDRRVGYWLCIDPKTGEYYLLTSAALAELNGLRAMYRLPAVYYRIVLTRDWNVKLGPHVIGTHLDTSAYIKDLDGFFARIEAKNTVIFMTFEEAKQQAIERSEWVLCHGAGYYTARTPDGRNIIGKGENGVFVGGEYRRVVVRVHKATESIEVYFGMEQNGLISALEVGGDRRETRPATEAEEKEAVTYLRQRNYTHFKLSKRCALKR